NGAQGQDAAGDQAVDDELEHVGTLTLETRRWGDAATRRREGPSGPAPTQWRQGLCPSLPASPRRFASPCLLSAATQKHGTNFGVGEQRLAGVLVAVLPHRQHIPTVRTLQRLAGVLLHDEYSDTSTIDIDDLFEDHAHQHWR